MSTVRLLNVRYVSSVLLFSMLVTLLALASPPSASAHVGHSHQLRLIELRCFITEDGSTDEPYLKVGGITVWGPGSMSAGAGASLTGVPIQWFRDSTTIKLYDKDGPFDPDDYLGGRTISASEAGLGYRYAYFMLDGASYRLKYQVI